MTDQSETAYLRLDSEPVLNRDGEPKVRGQRFSPVLHVLLPDGTTETFRARDRAVVMHDADSSESHAIYAMLVTRDGVPFVDPKGRPIILAAPPVSFHAKESDETPLTWKGAAKRAGVSVSSVRRAVDAGELPKPSRVGERSVRFRLGVVRAWIARKQRQAV